jgi:NitT/TauT family transport system substrate-binding protein
MQKKIYRIFFAFIIPLLGFFVPSASHAADAVSAKKIVLYTALTATSPQIPLWAAIKQGWPEGYQLQVEYWKTLDDLRGVMLAGKGDIWVGNLEGFAQAAKRGAPVTLIAITAWKKFYFVTSADEKTSSLEEMAVAMKKTGEALAIAPQDSPALGVLGEIGKKGGPVFKTAPMPPQQLMLEMMKGSRKYALLPEPFLSVLLAKKKDIRIVASLEEAFSSRFGGVARLPFAGIAVKTDFAKANPELIKKLVQIMEEVAPRLNKKPEEAIAVLPESVRKNLGHDLIKTSLSRDLIHVESAEKARSRIADFLKITLPASQDSSAGERWPSATFILPEPK